MTRGSSLVLLAVLSFIQNSSAFTPRNVVSPRGVPRSLLSTPDSNNNGESIDPNTNDQSIRSAYDQWRFQYDKGASNAQRFDNFKTNYLTLAAANAVAIQKAQERGRSDPSLLSLNEYGDCTTEEYKAIRSGAVPPPEPEVLPATGSQPGGFQMFENMEDFESALSDFQDTEPVDRVKSAYKDWCETHGKDMDDRRYTIFSGHYLAVKEQYGGTGKEIKLNRFADLTAEEYERMMELESPNVSTAESMLTDPEVLRLKTTGMSESGSTVASLSETLGSDWGDAQAPQSPSPPSSNRGSYLDSINKPAVSPKASPVPRAETASSTTASSVPPSTPSTGSSQGSFSDFVSKAGSFSDFVSRAGASTSSPSPPVNGASQGSYAESIAASSMSSTSSTPASGVSSGSYLDAIATEQKAKKKKEDEEKARLQAETEKKAAAEKEVTQLAEQKAMEAEERVRLQAETEEKAAEAKKVAEQKAKESEERARLQAETEKKAAAEKEATQLAKQKVMEADERVRLQAETEEKAAEAKKVAEQKAKEAEERARLQAETEKKAAAEKEAEKVAEQKAKDAEEKTRLQAEAEKTAVPEPKAATTPATPSPPVSQGSYLDNIAKASASTFARVAGAPVFQGSYLDALAGPQIPKTSEGAAEVASLGSDLNNLSKPQAASSFSAPEIPKVLTVASTPVSAMPPKEGSTTPAPLPTYVSTPATPSPPLSQGSYLENMANASASTSVPGASQWSYLDPSAGSQTPKPSAGAAEGASLGSGIDNISKPQAASSFDAPEVPKVATVASTSFSENPATEVSAAEPFDRVKFAYKDWCKKHGKDMADSRYRIFSGNFLAAEEQWEGTATEMKLNQYADFTVVEYERMMKVESPNMSTTTSMSTAPETSEMLPAPQTEASTFSSAPSIEEKPVIPPVPEPMAASIPATPRPTVFQGASSIEEKPVIPPVPEPMAATIPATPRPTMFQVASSIEEKAVPEWMAVSAPATARPTVFQGASSIEEDPDRVKFAYKDWCKKHGKDMENSRYRIFSGNFLAVEEQWAGTGTATEMKLNQYADFTVEEYERMMKGESPNVSTATSMSAAPETSEMLPAPQTEASTFSSAPSIEKPVIPPVPEPMATSTPATPRPTVFQGASSIEERPVIPPVPDPMAASTPATPRPTVFQGSYLDNIGKNSESASARVAWGSVSQGSYLDGLAGTQTPKTSEGAADSAAEPFDRVKFAYKDWCKKHGKDMEDSRYRIFSGNFLAVEEQWGGTATEMKLNQYADYTVEEYERMMNGESPNVSTATSMSTAPETSEMLPAPQTEASTFSSAPSIEKPVIPPVPEPTAASTPATPRPTVFQGAAEGASLGSDFDNISKPEAASSFGAPEVPKVASVASTPFNEKPDPMAASAPAIPGPTVFQGFTEGASLGSNIDNISAPEVPKVASVANAPFELSATEPFDRVKFAYKDWCEKYGKDMEDSRYRIFSGNFLAVEAQWGGTATEMKLNQYADYTVEEYERMLKLESSDVSAATSMSTAPETSAILPAPQIRTPSDAKIKDKSTKSAPAAKIAEPSGGSFSDSLLTLLGEPAPAKKEAETETEKSVKEEVDFASQADSIAAEAKAIAEKEVELSLTREAERLEQADIAGLKAKLEAQAAEAKELQLLKEALDAAQRLDEDENVAEIARDQTREWEEIQRKLSKEDDESKERRAKEENKNLASDKARAIETETDGEEKDAASESASDAFTFFGNLFGGTEKALKAPRDTRSTIVIQTAEPQEKPEKDWAATVFDFFGGSKPEEKKEAPSRGTIMIEEEKKRSVFEFFGSTDEVEKEMGPGRGTIRVNEEETPSNFSFFSGSSASKSTDKKVNQADSEKKPSDFFFGGSEEKGREESTDAAKGIAMEIAKQNAAQASERRDMGKGAAIALERAQKMEETQKNLGYEVAEAAERRVKQDESDKQNGLVSSFFGGNTKNAKKTSTAPFSTSAASKKADAKQGTPSLSMWAQNLDGSITGFISNSKDFRTGTKITTSPVKKGAKAGTVVTTGSGSQYRLGLISGGSGTAAGFAANSKKTSAKFASSTFQLKKKVRPSDDDTTAGGEKPSVESLFGGGAKKASGSTKKTEVKTELPILTQWIENPDGTISGLVKNKQNVNDGTKITLNPTRRGAKAGSVVRTGGGGQYRLGLMQPSKQNTMAGLSAGSSVSADSKDDIPALTDWKQNPDDGCITGSVKNNKKFKDGTLITTSPVLKGAKAGSVVRTKAGSRYRLL